MSLEFNTHTIIDIELSYPKIGTWHSTALFWKDDFPELNETGALIIDDLNLIGTVVNVGNSGEHVKCQIVGGYGTLNNKPKAAKHLSTPNGKSILDALLKDSDEILSPPDFDVLTYQAPQWQITKDSEIGKQLSRFVEVFQTYTWRINNLGLIEIKDNSSPSTFDIPKKDFILIDTRNDGSKVYEVTELTSFPYPGMKIEDDLIEEVILKASKTKIELHLLKSSLVNLIDIITNRNHKNLLRNSYEAVVQSQNADGTLNVIPKDRTIKGGGVKNVPIRFGTANLIVRSVPANTVCTIQFDSSNPSKIWCSGFQEASSYEAVNTFGDPDSAQYVALYDDLKTKLATLKTEIDAFITEYNAHVHATAGTGTPSPPSPLSTATITAIEDFQSSKLKTE